MDVTSGESGNSSPQENGWNALKDHVLRDKIQVGLWCTRVLTIVLTQFYMFPIVGNANHTYYKILLSNGASSALRLYQRVPRVQLNMEFLQTLMLEDSFHYLFYTLIFLFVSPSLLVLCPVFFFALLHSASYSLTLLDCLGQNSWWPLRFGISVLEANTSNILRICGLWEILLMPITILFVLAGHAGILTPIIYYQFLHFRLVSRRNPTTRNVFHEIRRYLHSLAMKPSMPEIFRRIILGFVAFTQHISPAPPTTQ
ncbi:Krueppel homolog 2 [Orussus abietinus]|uniref:Krueppel homolog 2 n=1 Tax=Orussus abietinus TaxID=222816 RepID=UPI000626A3F3|nr:Krueppel homolog 2 [Orussus abietinus]XP_012284621.1 Krueppel homolog 2 [Orussus abietinus]XP_012284629.1 Krueppel homolog 2 [Orussus abietinus]